MRSEMKTNLPEIGLTAKALNAEKTSSFIDCADASELTLLFSTATRVTFTALHFEVDWYFTDQGTPTAYESLGISQAVSGLDLLGSLYPDKYTYTVAATVAGKAFTIPCKARFCKVRVSATIGDATDLITVGAVLIKTA